jgi:lipoyl(octanoyl) transferase
MQRQLLQQEQQPTGQRCAGYLYILQHTPVYTLGTTLGDAELPLRPEFIDTALQFDVHRSDRAGEATFHGPGQVVFYPIIDLNYFDKDINWYLRSLEGVIVEALKSFGISAGRIPGLTGVWVGNSKVAAMGIKLRRWITLRKIVLNYAKD